MSTTRPRAPKRVPAITPMIGVLLRFPHEIVLARMLAALADAGLELTPTELGVFLYPGPDGRRPSELARQCNATRQAMNYVLASLEERGFVERRAGAKGPQRVVRLTGRGWEALAVIRRSVSEVEKEWSARLGARRFEALRETLRDLSVSLGKLPAPAAAPASRRGAAA